MQNSIGALIAMIFRMECLNLFAFHRVEFRDNAEDYEYTYDIYFKYKYDMIRSDDFGGQRSRA